MFQYCISKVILAKWAVCLDFEPVSTTLLVEVMLHVALKNDYFIFALKFLLANAALSIWNNFVIVAIWNTKKGQDVGLQSVIISLLCSIADLVIDTLKPSTQFWLWTLLIKVSIDIFELSLSKVILNSVS